MRKCRLQVLPGLHRFDWMFTVVTLLKHDTTISLIQNWPEQVNTVPQWPNRSKWWSLSWVSHNCPTRLTQPIQITGMSNSKTSVPSNGCWQWKLIAAQDNKATLHRKNSILDSHSPQGQVFSLILCLGLCHGWRLSSYYDVELVVIGS